MKAEDYKAKWAAVHKNFDKNGKKKIAKAQASA